MSDCGTFLRHRDVAAPGEEAESREGLGRCALGEDGAATLIARRRAGGKGPGIRRACLAQHKL